MIQHHPDSRLLVDYATGALVESAALSIACHVAMCARCRDQVNALEQIGGELLEDMDTAALSPDVLKATLARLDEPVVAAATPRIDEATRRVLPSPLWPYVGVSLDALSWRRFTPALKSARLAIAGAAHRVELLRIAAGRAVPRHTHNGEELTLVLVGGYTDETGHFGRGDFAHADEQRVHRPVADSGEDCIALAVLDAPVKPTGVIGRLLGPLVRS